MRRACVGGLDDGFFRRGWSSTIAALAVMCWRGSVLCPSHVLLGRLTVDGLDATPVASMLARRALEEGYELGALLLDTVVFAGFNVLDPALLHAETGVPVVVVYWYPPRREAVERALRLHFRDWRERLGILEAVWSRLRRVECPRGGLLVAPYGMGYGEAWRLVCRLQLYTRAPEPLYLAHVAASGLSRSLLGAAP